MSRWIIGLTLGFALLMVGVLSTALWAQGQGETLTVTITQTPEDPLEDIWCDDDQELAYTASYDNPFPGSLQRSITDPKWTWSVSNLKLNGSSPPVDSYTMVESQDSPGSANYYVTFSGHFEGEWKWDVTANVMASNSSDKENDATGTKTLTTVQKVDVVGEAFKVEAHPNIPLGWPRSNTYVLLPRSIPVLKGWKCRYTGRAPGNAHLRDHGLGRL